MARTIWIDTLIDQQVANASSAFQSLMSGVTALDTRLKGMTLMRTIIGVDIAHLVHDSGEGSQDFTVGIGVTTQEAFNAGVIPDPNSETDFPTRGWVWRYRCRTYGFAADQAAVYNLRVDKDIRSRRRLENGECYIVMNNDADQGSTGTVNLIGLIRQLWLVS